MTITKLDAGFIEEFPVWGLLCAFPGHKLCWEMNRLLGLELTRQEDIMVERRPQAKDAFFSFYSFDDEHNFLRYELIRNKCNGKFYLRDLKNFDYILMVKGELDFFDKASFSGTLKKIPGVLSLMEIDLDKIKHHEHLLLE